MAVMLGGPMARGQRVQGDIVISFQYVNDEPAMVLFPRRSMPGAGAFVICLSSAYKYVDSRTGQPTLYLFEKAEAAAVVMGMGNTRFTVYRIADLIASNLPDLIEMKPAPEPGKRAVGEGRLLVDGQPIDFEMTEDVPGVQ